MTESHRLFEEQGLVAEPGVICCKSDLHGDALMRRACWSRIMLAHRILVEKCFLRPGASNGLGYAADALKWR